MAGMRNASIDIMPLHELEKAVFMFMNVSDDYQSHLGLVSMLLDDEQHREKATIEEEDSKQVAERKEQFAMLLNRIQQDIQDLMITLNRLKANEEIVESIQRMEGYINDYLNA